MPDFVLSKLKVFTDAILYSSIFIGLCAVAQALLTFKLIKAPISFSVLSLLFFSTFFIYNLDSLFFSGELPPKKEMNKRVVWINRNRIFLKTATFLSFFFLAITAFYLRPISIVLMGFTGIIALLYSIPVFKGKGLKHIPGLKLFLISLTWAISVVSLPIVESHIDLSVSNHSLLLLKRFIFISALAIPFDMRDIYSDHENHMKTIPLLLGEKGTKILCSFLLGFYLLLLYFYDFGGNSPATFSALAISNGILAWMIFQSSLKKNEYYYLLGMDGMMIVQSLLVYLFTFLAEKI